ncbi:MAG: DUF3107 domain-containing protein [Actinobacteria bacterium]|nr:DUF3107 domain-containing protein [Actinomycetota bacterium]
MDVRIGVTHAPKELSLEMDGTFDEVAKEIEKAISGKEPFLWFTDKRGIRVGVSFDKLAYVEIEGGDHSRQVGFNT